MPGDDPLELKDIKPIIDLMKKNELAVFKLEKEGFKLELEAHRPAAPVSAPGVASGVVGPLGTTSTVVTPIPAVVTPESKVQLKEIVSPMVGTFYRAPSPDSAPYVQVGQEVTEESVVCIIEAMKVMNEIKAEARGLVVETLVENGTPVQFGQPLFRLK